MAVTSGFFNAVKVSGVLDRLYNADDVNEFFDGFATDGVLSTVSGTLIVEEVSGMMIKVNTGKAWFNRSYLKNTDVLYLTLSASHLTFDRIDTVIMDFDKTVGVRSNTIMVLEGTPSATPVAPTLTVETDHVQIPLADIYVTAGTTLIDNGDITVKVGTVDCPFSTGLLQQLNITALFNNWEVQFNEWMDGIEDILTGLNNGDVLALLNEMFARTIPGRNIIINGDMLVNQRSLAPVASYSASSGNAYPGVADRWKHTLNNAGTWTLSRNSLGNNQTSYKMECTTAKASASPGSIFTLEQVVEASRLGELLKGTVDAKELTLTWNFKTNVTGNYIAEIQDLVNGWSISKSFNVPTADVWQTFEWVIPAETTQAIPMNNDGGLSVNFWLVAGSNFNTGSLKTSWGATVNEQRAFGQVNVAAVATNYVEFTDVQLELGGLSTEYERRSHDDVLNDCLRYSEFIENAAFLCVALTTTTAAIYDGQYRIKKRGQPAYSFDHGIVYTPTADNVLTFEEGLEASDKTDRASYYISTQGTYLMTANVVYRCYLSDIFVDAEL